ncbi:hypothetical protein Sjap_000513 [Stephania japonica]|uniref:Uncharacterized protein n=1 Tax=Stephania japonica TaxID=461633 RepID=A0AAP0KJS7_9MAGN
MNKTTKNALKPQPTAQIPHLPVLSYRTWAVIDVEEKGAIDRVNGPRISRRILTGETLEGVYEYMRITGTIVEMGDAFKGLRRQAVFEALNMNMKQIRHSGKKVQYSRLSDTKFTKFGQFTRGDITALSLSQLFQGVCTALLKASGPHVCYRRCEMFCVAASARRECWTTLVCTYVRHAVGRMSHCVLAAQSNYSFELSRIADGSHRAKRERIEIRIRGEYRNRESHTLRGHDAKSLSEIE